MLYLNVRDCDGGWGGGGAGISTGYVTLWWITLYYPIRGEEGAVETLPAEPSVKHRLVLTYSVKDFFLLLDFLSRLQPWVPLILTLKRLCRHCDLVRYGFNSYAIVRVPFSFVVYWHLLRLINNLSSLKKANHNRDRADFYNCISPFLSSNFLQFQLRLRRFSWTPLIRTRFCQASRYLERKPISLDLTMFFFSVICHRLFWIRVIWTPRYFEQIYVSLGLNQPLLFPKKKK